MATALSAEEFVIDRNFLMPALVLLMQDVRRGHQVHPSQATGAPRDVVKQLFGNAATRPALLTRLGLADVLTEGDFYAMVDVAARQL